MRPALIAFVLAALAWACSCQVPFRASQKCSGAEDCPPGSTCTAGQCLPCQSCPADAGVPPAPPDASASDASTPDAPDASGLPDAGAPPDATMPPDAGLCDQKVCQPSDGCHLAGVCDPSTGLCSDPPRPEGDGCDDGEPCTRSDTCRAGVCVGGPPRDDGTACASGLCVAGVCRPPDWPVALAASGPDSVVAGECSTAITITRLNAAGQPAAAADLLNVALGGAGAGQFFSDGGCTRPVTSIDLAPGSASVEVRFSGTTAQSLALTFSAGTLSPAGLALHVVAAAPSRLELGGATAAPANACTPLTVTRRDAFGNLATGPAATVTLGGQGRGAFHSTGACDAPASGALIANGASEAAVWFTSGYVEPTLTLTASGLTVPATHAMTITGPFDPPVDVPPATSGLPSGWQLASLATADFDRDGHLDVAVTETNQNRVCVAWGDGAGSFSPGPRFAVPAGPIGLAAASLRGGGKTDLLVASNGASAGSGNLSVILGNGDRTFQPPAGYGSSGTKAWAFGVEASAGLLGTDASVDVVVTYRGDAANGNARSGVDVFPGNGDGTLGLPLGYPKDGIAMLAPAIGDVDGDGRPDVVVPVSGGDANATWFRNAGGSFTQSLLNPGSGHWGTVWAFGDFNGDAFLDHAQALSWWGAFVDKGTGTASIPILMGDQSVNDVAYTRARTGAFRAGGHTDALFAGSSGSPPRPGHNGVLYYPCDGAGSCGTVVVYHFVETMADFVAGDFDEDGLPDLVALTADGTLHFLSNSR